MDSSTLKAIDKYGIILSVTGIALAVLASVVGGPIGTTALLFFGWAGPLGLFYFGGAYLSEFTSHYTVGEELLRGIVWYFGSLVGVAFLISETNALAASPATIFGLPALTALGITLVMVIARHVTGSDLKVESEGGQLLMTITGGLVFGFLALYLVLADEAGWWLFGLYLLSIPVGLALRRLMRKRYPNAFGTN